MSGCTVIYPLEQVELWSGSVIWSYMRDKVYFTAILKTMIVEPTTVFSIGSITSRCPGKEPALLPRTHFSGRVDQTRESGGNRAYFFYCTNSITQTSMVKRHEL